MRLPREYLTEEQFDEKYRRGGRRLAPGFWLDRDGALHVSVPELRALVNLPETPEERAVLADVIDDLIEKIEATRDVIYCDRLTPARKRSRE